MVTAISYDGFDLNDGTYNTVDLNPMGSPSKKTTTLDLARADGSLRVFQKFASKNIILTGRIISDTKANLDLAIDALKMQMRREMGDLQYEWGNGVRIHNCTAVDVKCEKGPGDISTCPFQIVFECESPFATDGVTDTWMNAAAITTSTSDMNITINGTMDAQPIITITVTAINPTISNVTMTVANTSNSQYLDITSTFAAGDIVIIDCVNYRVFKNGVLIKASGQFPYWATGAGVLHYEDTATTRTLAVTTTSERRYL